LKRILSLGVGERLGGAAASGMRLLLDVEGEDLGGGANWVLRVKKVVSAEGGGGKELRRDARHRKHSPLPK
jgi:hypothetical protein